MTEPTILVKKADGSLVRLPLSQIKKMKGGTTKEVAPTKAAPAVSVLPSRPTMPTKPPMHSPAIPEEPLRGSRAKTIAAAAADFASLLEEALPQKPAITNLPRTSPSREQEVEKIIQALTFSVATEHKNRLRTVIQLYLKDVRSEDDTREVLGRRALDGGLGLTLPQVGEVMRLAEAAKNPMAVVSSKRFATARSRANRISGSTLPAPFVEPPTPALATPFNSFVHEAPVSAPSAIFSPRQASAPPNVNPSQPPSEPTLRLSATPKAKTIMHDIVARPTVTSPVEEIKSLTLTDFRRLASNPSEAAARVKQKFLNLREESVLLFLDAWSAWKNSPLYADYITVATDFLARGRKLETTLADKSKIQLAEVKALIDMERALAMV